MSAVDAHHPHEIIIVRHGGHGDHDDHHGGAWKIAFADFMTAMMCFFLVMWLINAANEQTKASVASYFNPVKLIDRNSSRKGLEDIGDGPNAIGQSEEVPKEVTEPAKKAGTEGQGQTGPAEKATSKDMIEEQVRSDESLFADPYAVLAEIAAETGKMQNISAKGDGGAQTSGPATGASGGESYRDPFAPDFWSQQVVAPEESVDLVDESDAARQSAVEPRRPTADIFEDSEPLAPAPEPVAETPPVKPSEAIEVAEEAEQDTATEATAKAIAAAERIKDELEQAFRADDELADNIDVTVKDGAVIISVTDQLDFGMFEIGSAIPRGELVLAMEKIGRIVAAQPGEVVVNGHTDARPFRSREYDNWRLSSARAQSAYYMLVRGGLGEDRVKSVAGYADRRPRIADNPLAAANRRIEILIETTP